MRVFARVILLTFLGLAATPSFADHHKPTSAEDFQDFVEATIGRWSGEITLAADWPGRDKKRGDKIINYHISTPLADGHGVLEQIVGGATTATNFFSYDPAGKKIRVLHSDSAGGYWEADIWREGQNEWGWKLAGAQSDGTTLSGKGQVTFGKNNNEKTISGTLMIGGEPVDPLKDVYQRLGVDQAAD